jgi:hypothetical protein
MAWKARSAQAGLDAMSKLTWHTLVQVREAGERRAQQHVARDEQTAALTARQLFTAQADWLARREAGLQHRLSLQRAAAEGSASVAALRHAGHWDQALQQRLLQAGRTVQEAMALHEQAQHLLALSRRELRQASAQVEKARHVQGEARRTELRDRERRQDELADEAALQRAAMTRRS